MDSTKGKPSPQGTTYKAVLRRELRRVFLLYFAPLLLLSLFFHFQYRRLMRESHLAHLTTVAENRASTLDLFLRERWIDLFNVIDDPGHLADPDQARLQRALEQLQTTSDAFVDLGQLDELGNLRMYVGPHQFPQSVNYGDEPWFEQLLSSDQQHIVTDIYLGFRDEPHFTVAVRRDVEGVSYVLRSALDPAKLYGEIVPSDSGERERIVVVNVEGYLQIAPDSGGQHPQQSAFVPPREPAVGVVEASGAGAGVEYAYARLDMAPWTLAVTSPSGSGLAMLSDPGYRLMVALTVAALLFAGVVLWIRARFLATTRIETDRAEAELSGQLVHAAKLASVGELAAGIAHEINNPLAIIAEEIGMMKDLQDPQFGGRLTTEELNRRLDAAHSAVFRCRDITQKLLSFVRQRGVKILPHDVNEIVDEAADGLLGRELSLAHIEVVKRYGEDLPSVHTDRAQILQVLVNLIRNAVDAMEGGGQLTLETRLRDGRVSVSVRDTGCGMTSEQMEHVFTPFFTTKPSSKGTGLGLSVSLSIIKNLGGEFFVDSEPGVGSRFRFDLPTRQFMGKEGWAGSAEDK